MHEGYLALLIPIFGIAFGLGFPFAALIVFLILEHRKRRRLIELYHAERMAAIERGMEIPPIPIELLKRQPRRRSGLLPGLITSLVGVAFLFLAVLTRVDGFYIPGAISLAVGVAFLIYYAVEGRQNTQNSHQNGGASAASVSELR